MASRQCDNQIAMDNCENALPGTTSPEFVDCGMVAIMRSMSAVLRTLTGVNSTPSEEAADWIAP